MTPEGAIDLFRDAMWVSTKVAGPLLLVALVVGLVVGVIQAATQINEASIAFVFKLLVLGGALLLLGPWLTQQLIDYTTRSIASIEQVTK